MGSWSWQAPLPPGSVVAGTVGSTSTGSPPLVDGIGHVIEVGLSGEEAVVCRQGVVRLFGGHAVQFTVHDVLEAAAIYIVAQQRVNDRVTVLDEPGVGIRIDAQSGQCGNDLRNGFAGGNLRRAVVGGWSSRRPRPASRRAARQPCRWPPVPSDPSCNREPERSAPCRSCRNRPCRRRQSSRRRRVCTRRISSMSA